jgi:hypothetical protein
LPEIGVPQLSTTLRCPPQHIRMLCVLAGMQNDLDMKMDKELREAIMQQVPLTSFNALPHHCNTSYNSLLTTQGLSASLLCLTVDGYVDCICL